jgi:hypothetical protein
MQNPVDLDIMLKKVFEDAKNLKHMDSDTRSQLGQVLLSMNAMYKASHATPMINRHFARLFVDGVDLESSGYFTLDTQRKYLNQQKNTKTKWEPMTLFPSPEQDFLLHGCFLGGKCISPIFDKHGDLPFRLLIKDLNRKSLEFPDSFNVNFCKNSDQQADDGSFMEILLVSLVCYASRCNGLSGSRFVDVLKFVAYHLGTARDGNHNAVENAYLLGDFAERLFPVLSAPNTMWPKRAKEWFPLSNFKRSRNLQCIDMESEVLEGERVTGEAKFRTKNIGSNLIGDILKRVPKDSWCHIVMCTSIMDKEVQFPEGNLKSFLQNIDRPHLLILCLKIRDNGSSTLQYLPGMNFQAGTKNQQKSDKKTCVVFVEVPKF